jgi:hypothetical protein
MLSLFGGFLGLDRFYLGDRLKGLAKLATLGGAGFWWVADIVLIGSSPIYAFDPGYRLAADLPKTNYTLLTVIFFALLGYFVFGVLGSAVVGRNKKAKLLLKAEDNFFRAQAGTVDESIEESSETDTGSQTVPINFHPLHRKAPKSFISLIPTGLGDYGATGISRYNLTGERTFAVPGGPYRNANYFNAMGGRSDYGP